MTFRYRFTARLCFHVIAIALLFSILGCGDSGPKKYPVTGNVTWEGQPLADGDIVLEPTDGGVPDHGKIVAGKIDMEATAGPKKVSIQATKAAAEVDPDMGMAPQVQYIPHRYNARTELTAEVKADGENRLTFDLVP